MTRRAAVILWASVAAIPNLIACAPTIDVKVEPISIYAKLDADIRIKLDKEVQTAIQQNPTLF
jgi:hypothetical protein